MLIPDFIKLILKRCLVDYVTHGLFNVECVREEKKRKCVIINIFGIQY